MKKFKSLFNPFNFEHVKSTKGNHAFANSYLKLRFAKLLRLEDYERLLSQENIEELFKVLEEGYDYPELSLSSLKDSLLKERKKTTEFILSSIGNRMYGKINHSPIAEFFLLPLDVFNLKVLSKGLLENYDWQNLPLSSTGFVSHEQLKFLYQNIPVGFLHPLIKKSWLSYLRIPEAQRTSYSLDTFWDNELQSIYSHVLNKLKSEIISTLHATRLDIKNILAVVRLKKSGKTEEAIFSTIKHFGSIRVDILKNLFDMEFENASELFHSTLYGKEMVVGIESFKETKDFSSLEKYLEEFWLKACFRFVPMSYNEDLAIIYDYLKQNEYSNIQTIISGKQNKMSQTWILSHLRVVL